MGDIVLRKLDDQLKERLRQRAARNSRSMSEELREIVREALTGQDRRAEFRKLSAEVRALSAGKAQTPSEVLVRESRDER
ncbi:MAG: ribbon-helix-helix protein, CopG family [Gammaproteobacteria bacterium]|nr:ribbon-helix-helix protein, CopG family [Gammaproteobacteria bacterium]